MQNYHSELAVQIHEYLTANFQDRITLDMLAKKYCISISHLRRIYREQMGVTIFSHLTAVRIHEAKRLIREEKLMFSQIAEAVGYSNAYYFSSQFKKYTGMTPTEYSHSIPD